MSWEAEAEAEADEAAGQEQIKIKSAAPLFYYYCIYYSNKNKIT